MCPEQPHRASFHEGNLLTMAIETDMDAGPERRRFCRRSLSEFQMLTADVLPAGTERRATLYRAQHERVRTGRAAVPAAFPGEHGGVALWRAGNWKALDRQGNGSLDRRRRLGRHSTGRHGFLDARETAKVGRRRPWTDPAAAERERCPSGRTRGAGARNRSALDCQTSPGYDSAHGAAIALGDAESMVCRASTGTAPDLGVSLRSGFGLAGECICTGRIAQTVDARSDPRIDAAVARQLQLGSAVIMPICSAEKITGVLGVFSRHPRAFDDFHLRRLQRLTAVIASSLDTPNTPPDREFMSASGAKFVPSEEFRFATLSGSGAKPPVSAPHAGRPLNRLESLWNLIETAHRGARSNHMG